MKQNEEKSLNARFFFAQVAQILRLLYPSVQINVKASYENDVLRVTVECEMPESSLLNERDVATYLGNALNVPMEAIVLPARRTDQLSV